MKLFLSRYRTNVDFIKYCYEKSDKVELKRLASEVSVSTNVPVIVVTTFLLEIIGPNEELEKNLEDLKTFYQIEEVVE